MKKVVKVVIITLTLMFFNSTVYAKDTVYTINKYKEEELKYIIKSYTDTKEDGYIVAGTYLKDAVKDYDKEYKDKQILIVKYDKTGNIIWKYDYGKEGNDKLVNITYSYDQASKINGYTIIANKEYKSDDELIEKPVFIILNQKGKEIKEVDLNISNEIEIKKVISTEDNNNKKEYIVVGLSKKENKNVGFIAKYNSEYEKKWEKEYDVEQSSHIELKDIISVNNEYLSIAKIKEEDEVRHQLLKFSSNGELLKVIKEDFEAKDEPSLINIDDEYAVYGKTYEVKLNNQTESYYLKKFNNKDEIEWETIGSDSIDANKIVDTQSIEDGILLLYVNGQDKSIEIVKIDKEGTIQNKIRKINNEYYNINDFLYSKETIYFVGQIKCPKDETCDYIANSLFLISDKDKVIEVDDRDSKIIIVSILVFLSFIGYLGVKSKRKKLSEERQKKIKP